MQDLLPLTTGEATETRTCRSSRHQSDTGRSTLDPHCPSHERNLREEIKVGSTPTYVTQVVLISSWNGLWNSFQTTWRKEIKDQLTRMDSMWTSDYISWRALQVSIIKKKLSKKLGLFHSNPVRSSMSTNTSTNTWKRSQTPQWRAWLFRSLLQYHELH